MAGGTALAKLLFGEECFSGRLPLTFYHNVEDLPDFTDYNMKNRTYRYYEGKALYPFGFGLSYTTFATAVKEACEKMEKAGLTTVKSEFVNAPVINEFPMTVECNLLKFNELVSDFTVNIDKFGNK